MLLEKSLQLHDDITCMFVKDQYIYIGSFYIYKVDIENGEIVETYTNESSFILPSSIFVNDQYIFAGFDSGYILQLDVNTGKQLNLFSYHSDEIYHLFMSDTILFSNSKDNKLVLYDIVMDRRLEVLISISGPCNFVVKGNYLFYIGHSNGVTQYDFINDKIIKQFKELDDPITNIYLLDSNLIINTNNGTNITINIENEMEFNVINLGERVDFFHISDKNDLYIANRLNHSVVKYDFEDESAEFLTLPSKITGMSIQNNYLICCSINGTINIYDTEKEEIKEEEDQDKFDNMISSKNNLKDEENYYKDDNIHCTNNNVFTLEPYTKEDEPIQIYTLNNQNKFEISTCITIDEITHHLTAGKNTLHPSMLMSICTPQSHATGKIIISLPPNNLFYTYGSIKKLLSDKKNKTWFALPLFGDKKRRVGNLDEAPLIGSLHCQIPGYKVYKLYTLNELNSEDGLEVVETLSDYPEILYDYLEDVFDLKENITKDFINKLLDNLIKLTL